MRCKNCGWPNRPGETTCAKCHQPLDSTDDQTFTEPQHLNATVREQGPVYEENVEETVCPRCGYPIREHASKCPKCGYDLPENFSPIKNAAAPQRRLTRMENFSGQDKAVSGTINPYIMSQKPEPTFILRPIQKINEKKEFADLEYVGSEVVLNRKNTEEDNMSITSHKQALLTYENGKWCIEDKSEQGTTFVKAARRIVLEEGDILLIGDRKFEFHIVEE